VILMCGLSNETAGGARAMEQGTTGLCNLFHDAHICMNPVHVRTYARGAEQRQARGSASELREDVDETLL